MTAIATGHNATGMSGCTLPASSRRTRIGRTTIMTVATNTNHGTNLMKLRLSVRLAVRLQTTRPAHLETEAAITIRERRHLPTDSECATQPSDTQRTER